MCVSDTFDVVIIIRRLLLSHLQWLNISESNKYKFYRIKNTCTARVTTTVKRSMDQ